MTEVQPDGTVYRVWKMMASSGGNAGGNNNNAEEQIRGTCSIVFRPDDGESMIGDTVYNREEENENKRRREQRTRGTRGKLHVDVVQQTWAADGGTTSAFRGAIDAKTFLDRFASKQGLAFGSAAAWLTMASLIPLGVTAAVATDTSENGTAPAFRLDLVAKIHFMAERYTDIRMAIPVERAADWFECQEAIMTATVAVKSKEHLAEAERKRKRVEQEQLEEIERQRDEEQKRQRAKARSNPKLTRRPASMIVRKKARGARIL